MGSRTTLQPAILLVDDNPHDAVLLRLAFRKVGIIDPIRLVKDGAEAMRYLQGEGIYSDRHTYPTPSLMLLDLNMPQTSGFAVLQWVREQPALKGLAIVVMTGSKESHDVVRAYQLGVESYLVKPTKFSELVEIMQALKKYCGMLGTGANGWRDPSLTGVGPVPVTAELTSSEISVPAESGS